LKPKLIYFVGFFFPTFLFATTFTSFPLVRQIEGAEYVVRGVVGAREMRLEPQSGRPYTYWNLAVTDAFSDAKLDGEIAIRQPGGEVGGMGYRVEGAADFQEGEDVIVLLRDTEESAKEVVGLVSGKVRVVRDEQGKERLENGLGAGLEFADGKPMDMESFRAFVQRVNTKDLTDADRSVMVDLTKARHSSLEREAHAPPPPGFKTIRGNESVPHQESLENIPSAADRQVASQSGSAWIGFLVASAFFVCAGLLYRLLTRKPE
jgi:hypothetical protein